MKIQEIENGDKIELFIKCNNRMLEFPSIVCMKMNQTLLIEKIVVDGKVLGFSTDCEIDFICNKNKALFIWEDVKVKVVKYKDQIYDSVELYGEGKPYNRREHFRLYIAEDMLVIVNDSEGVDVKKVLVKDISETGFSFAAKEEYAEGAAIKLRLKDSDVLIELSGTIIRHEVNDNINAHMYGCKFLEKSNKVNQYIAKKQRQKVSQKVKQQGLRSSNSY